ncbi:TPA: hypothetical protein N0F65_000523 [Lagenidium giganteum]|uniref:Uncharacterized protein n=1 Tax=Lagenidium giganteum TaxID=4803 RepID=A0AAV2YHN9_9STRA|nr:TPA: hypothetical protein N0F65_000523 [Lagenidium giganteum]
MSFALARRNIHDDSRARNRELKEGEELFPAQDLCVLDATSGVQVDSSQLMLARLPPVSELTKLEEQGYEEFLDDVKRGNIADVVLLWSEAEPSELNTSSVMDTSVLDEKAIAVFKRGSTRVAGPRSSRT